MNEQVRMSKLLTSHLDDTFELSDADKMIEEILTEVSRWMDVPAVDNVAHELARLERAK